MTLHRPSPSPSPSPSRSHPRRLLCALVAAAIAGSATAEAHPAAQDPPPPTPSPAPHIAPVYLPMLQRTWSTGSGPGYDVDHYTLDMAFDVRPSARAGAAATFRYTAATTIRGRTTADGVEEIAVDFTLLNREPLVVRLDGRPTRWTRSADKAAIFVRFPAAMPRGTPFALEIRYNHGPGFNAKYSGPDNAEIAQMWAVNNAGHAFPAGIDPLDRAQFTFTVTAPEPYVVVTNGRPTGEVTADGHTTVTWVTEQPITPSDAAVFIGRYTVTEVAGAGGVPITLYRIRPAAETQPTFDALVRQFGWFASRLGFAHDRMRYIEGGAQVSVGVPGLYIVGTADMNPNALALERNAAGQARQWFSLTNSFDASEAASWLHMGLNTYLGLLYLARDQGPEIVRARLNATEREYAAYVWTDLPLVHVSSTDRTDNEWSLIYSKPPFGVHGLRLALGDAAFWAALRRYLALAPDGAPSLAAFEAAVFESAGTTPALRALFDDAFRRAAVPRLHLAWSTAGGRARVRACQLTASPVAFTLPLALHGPAGVAATSIALDAADQVVELPHQGALDAVTPDPEQVLLADVIVHPRFDGALPACADLPPPALAAPVQPAVAAARPNARHGAATGRAADGEGAVAPAARHDHAVARAALDGPPPAAQSAAGPGEPSIGDPYIPRLGNTGYDVVTYTVKARIDPLAKHVAADTRVHARSVVSDLTRLSLDFHRVVGDAGLALSVVEVDGAPAPFVQPAESEKLWIDLPRPMAEGEAFEMHFVYAGTPRRVSGGLLPHSQDTMYAISCPSGTGNWIPVNDHPRDKAVWRFELTVPTPFRVTANGVRLSEHVGADETTAVFEMRQPMATYLATAAVGRYRTAEQAGPDGVTIRHHFLNDPAVGLGAVGVTPQILGLFSRLVAPYPFESYGHYAAPDQGSAMETQTMTAIGSYLLESRGPRGVQRLIAHEAAHQWFGNAVSPHSWADVWLNEGFATYFEVVWSVDDAGPEPFGWLMDGVRYSALRSGEDAPLSRPLYMFGTNSYDKGAWVLQMLRSQLGDAAFWRGLRAYYAAHRFGTASTDDFEAAMAAAAAGTGVDVAALFDQWVHRAGNPQVYVGWSQAVDGDVAVRLCQTGEPFDLPITLAAHGAGRTARTTARLSDTTADVRLAAPFPVDGVTPDPDVQLLADLRVVRLEDVDAATTCDEIVAAWSTGSLPPVQP